ncbi:MAG TPA: DUF4157 domain-containing protein [Gaiellaceae bacterium]|jgi:hypothetical protein|nr:DUF4157 domain-containing protein [Gaiellaceae bacterium]
MSSYERELEQTAGAKRPSAQTPDIPDAQRLASTMGNQAFSALARQGAGILPDGRAHPDVESAIAQTRGGGQKLDDGSREKIGGGLGDSLNDVRVHADDHANALAQSVSARAFTTGTDVYFAKGEHNPGSSEGQQLLAHELTHVVQQRGASTSGPLQVSQPGDALENEAEAAAGDLVG